MRAIPRDAAEQVQPRERQVSGFPAGNCGPSRAGDGTATAASLKRRCTGSAITARSTGRAAPPSAVVVPLVTATGVKGQTRPSADQTFGAPARSPGCRVQGLPYRFLFARERKELGALRDRLPWQPPSSADRQRGEVSRQCGGPRPCPRRSGRRAMSVARPRSPSSVRHLAVTAPTRFPAIRRFYMPTWLGSATSPDRPGQRLGRRPVC
jgi:hypothetical protein